jgi:hypothetical protein
MADAPVVHIGENSPEYVAFRLMRMIAANEKKAVDSSALADRDWIIRTYCMCLKAVQQPHYPDDALEIGKPKGQ